MINVSIHINGKDLYSRSARNIQDLSEKKGKTLCRYKLDTGETIDHVREEGAIKLVKKMLDTIEELYMNQQRRVMYKSTTEEWVDRTAPGLSADLKCHIEELSNLEHPHDIEGLHRVILISIRMYYDKYIGQI